jgi:hypothetical protein
MRWRRPLSTIIAAVLVASALRVAPLIVTVEGGWYKTEPAFVRLRIRVEPDKANRALAIGIESDGFSTSSAKSLDGDRAAITTWVEYRDVPAGHYVARAQVFRPGAADGETWHAETPFQVLCIRGCQ